MHRCQYILGTGERFQRLKPTEGCKGYNTETLAVDHNW